MSTPTANASSKEIIARIDAILDEPHLTETNSGTWGAGEGIRAIGTDDPKFANYSVYKTLRGKVSHRGCDSSTAPGRPRYSSLPNKKSEILDLVQQAIAAAEQELRSNPKYYGQAETQVRSDAQQALKAAHAIKAIWS